MLTLYKDPAAAIFLAMVVPTIALISVNTSLFSKRQMKNSSFLIMLLGGMAALGFHAADGAWLSSFSQEIFNDSGLAGRVVGCLLSLGIFFGLSERTFSELLGKRARICTMLSLTVVFTTVAAFFSIVPLTAVLLLYAAMSLVDLKKNFKDDENDFSSLEQEEVKEVERDIEFKHTPNVYVLFLESFHSAEALKSIYGIDNSGLCEHMEEKQFTLYDNCYSNHTRTGQSFSSMVWPRSMYRPLQYTEMNQLPHSHVFSTFEKNGYKKNLFSCEYLKIRFSSLFDYSVSDSSAIGSNMTEMFAPILAQSHWLREVFSTVDVFEYVSNFDTSFEDLKRCIRENKGKPQFNWFHFGAGHSPQLPWSEVSGFEEKYASMYASAEKELVQTVDMILDHDKDALIVAIGDHGATRYRLIEAGDNDPNAIIRSKGFEPELIGMDLCSVFLGIHWPVAHFTGGEVVSHVQLFDHIFAALSEDKSVLDNMMPNISLYNCQAGTVALARDGKLLKNWELVGGEQQLSFHIDEVERNPQDIIAHLTLVSQYVSFGKNDLALNHLVELSSSFPDSEEVHTKLARMFLDRNDLDKAKVNARKALAINSKSSTALYCLGVVAERENQDLDSGKFIQKAVEFAGGQVLPKNLYVRYAHSLAAAENMSSMHDMVNQTNHDRHWLITNIDWRAQYSSFMAGDHNKVFSWLDERIATATSLPSKMDALGKKLVLGVVVKRWELVEEVARDLILRNEMHIGAWISLGHSLENRGMIQEALQVSLDGLNKTKHMALMEQLAGMMDRHRIRLPELVQVKVLARKQMAERKGVWGKLASFDAQWYASEYGHLLNGMAPLDHYMYNSLAMMLSPNSGFDVAYYYSSQVDVLQCGFDASVHYREYGRHDQNRPRTTCLYVPSNGAEAMPMAANG